MKKKLTGGLLAALALSLTAVCLFAAPVNRNYTIEGTLHQVRESKVFLLKQYRSGQEADSAVLVNGRFRFEGILKDDIVAAMFTMHVPVTEAQLAENPFAGMSSRHFYLSPGKLVVSGNRLEDIMFAGTAEADDFMRLEGILGPINATLSRIGSQYRLISAMNEFPGKQDSLAAYSVASEKLADKYREAEKLFIKDHPASLLSMAMFRSMTEVVDTKDAEEMEVLLTGLSPLLRNREDMRAIRKRLLVLSRLVPGKPALEFSMPDSAGNSVTLSSYRGKYVLVEFWASWCGPCRSQTPYLMKSYATFKGRNFDILGISLDDNRQKWLKAIHEDKLPWTQVSELKGHSSKIVSKYAVTGIPLNFLIDPNGIIVATNLRNDGLYAKLAELLK